MALSEKQLEQRRAAGRALRDKVHPDYFKFIGRRGGRKLMFNCLMELAETWEGWPGIGIPKAKPEIVADARASYREEAFERYPAVAYPGQRVMIELWEVQSC